MGGLGEGYLKTVRILLKMLDFVSKYGIIESYRIGQRTETMTEQESTRAAQAVEQAIGYIREKYPGVAFTYETKMTRACYTLGNHIVLGLKTIAQIHQNAFYDYPTLETAWGVPWFGQVAVNRYVVHEFVHVLQPDGTKPHGPEYREILVRLIGENRDFVKVH